MVKVCMKCKVEKLLTEFNKRKISKDGFRSTCKSCKKEYDKQYRKVNKTILIEKNKKRYLKNRNKDVEIRLINKQKKEEQIKYLLKINKKKCTKCEKISNINNFLFKKSNKDGLDNMCKNCWSEYLYLYRGGKERQDKIKKEKEIKEHLFSIGKKKCTKCEITKSVNYFRKNKTKSYGLDSHCKQCSIKNAKIWRENDRGKYEKNRRKTNALFRLKKNLRTRTYSAFKRKGYSKNTKTQEMLGVDWEICKAHIERQFTKGMNWENQGDWHIDHIIPLASAKTSERLKKLCHYTNLQPLWAEENLSKSDSINGQQTLLRI